MQKKIVILYTEIAGYLLSCINYCIRQEKFEVHLFRYPVNKEAPFEFSFDPGLKIYNRPEYTTERLIEKISAIQPDVIICCGWIDKGYLKAVRHFSGKALTVLTMDTAWKGNLKQYIGAFLGRTFIFPIFNFCWVTGEKQKNYARKLGFGETQIFKGFYSADSDLFHAAYLSGYALKKQKFPKRFIYVGRYYAFKGIQNMWEAFTQLQQESPSEWELWCFGTGDVAPVTHPNIKHFGFVQADQMPPYLEQTGVFILPSHFEPWGVVVHEFAAAGFPLLCSKEVGAASEFLHEGDNGFFMDDKKVTAIKKTMKNITLLSDEKLNEMSRRSAEIGITHSPQKWTETLVTILSKG